MSTHTKMTKAELIKALKALEHQVRLGPPSEIGSDALHHHVVEVEGQNRELRDAQQLLEESRDRYADLYDFAPLGYVTLTEKGIVSEINLTAASMLGALRHAHIGKPFSSHLTRGDNKRFLEHLRHCRETDKAAAIEVLITRAKEVSLPVQLYPLPMANTDRGTLDYRVAIIDISQRKQAEEGLRLAATVFEHCGEAIVVCDHDTNIVSVNRAFIEITGYRPQEVIGKSVRQMDIGLQNDTHVPLWNLVTETGFWQGEAWGRRKDGTHYSQWLTVTRARNEAGQPGHYIGIFSDITQRKEADEHIRRLAHYDALTGLPNRALLEDRLAHALALAQRNNTGIAVLFLDIDLFKIVNDSLGHGVGDQLLQGIATRLTQCLRTGDTVSRRGGDEFIVVLPNLNAVEETTQIVEKILKYLCHPYNIDGVELNVTGSIGISMYPQDGNDVDTLIKHADIAMYHAKDSGRNNYKFYIRSLNADTAQRHALENHLHRALEREEFVLYYQPQIETMTGRLLGCEALIRWQHPDQGLILPEHFIPVAEKCGLIGAIGDWVLRAACAQNGQWRGMGLPGIPIAVNISAMQLRQEKFLQTIAGMLRESQMDPRLLVIELTESTLLQDTQRATACLEQMKAMGLQIVLDDFGTGYSSLGHLKHFPISKLKIDKSFIHDVPDNADDITLIRTIINMGHNLHLTVLAEGVETHAQYEFLRAQLCEEVQGDYFARPMTAADFAHLLQADRLQQTQQPIQIA